MPAYLKQIEGLVPTAVDDGFIIHDAAKNKVHYLNPTAALILTRCDGSNAVAEIALLLQRHFDLPEPPERKVAAILAQFVDEGLVVATNGGGARTEDGPPVTANGNPASADEPSPRAPLEERVSADRQQLLKLVLGSMTAYTAPLMTSFPAKGPQFGAAAAGTTLGENQTKGGFFSKIVRFLAGLRRSQPG